MDSSNISSGLRSSRRRSVTNGTPTANILSLTAFEQILSDTPTKPAKNQSFSGRYEASLPLYYSPEEISHEIQEEPEPDCYLPDLLPPKLEQLVTFMLPEWDEGELRDTATQTPKRYYNAIGTQTEVTQLNIDYHIEKLREKYSYLQDIQYRLLQEVDELKIARKHFESEKLSVAKYQNRQRQAEKYIKIKAYEIYRKLEVVQTVRSRVLISWMRIMEERYRQTKRECWNNLRNVAEKYQSRVYKFYSGTSNTETSHGIDLPVTLSHGRNKTNLMKEYRPLYFSFKDHRPGAVVPLLSLNTQNVSTSARSTTNLGKLQIEQQLNPYPQSEKTREPRKPIVRKGVNYPLNYKR